MKNVEIPSDVQVILDTLHRNQYEAYLVGGCVRDFLMGLKPADYDITTNATPEEIEEVFSNYATIPTGIKHGTVTVRINHQNYEITTYRKETNYLDHRHPSDTVFVNNLKEDLSRRDFTINAIAYDKDYVDYFNGIDDIKNKIIRSVNDPKLRFKEDALRILRALRFSSRLGFKIEENTKQAIFLLRDDLKYLSVERIIHELEGILLGDDVSSIINEYQIIFKQLFPLWTYNEEIAKNLPLLKKKNNLRIAYFLSSLEIEDALKSIRKYKISNELYDSIKEILLIIQNDLPNNKIEMKVLMNQFHLDNIYDALEIIGLNKDINNLNNWLNEIIKNQEVYHLSMVDINGNDIKQLGFEGKRIGEILNDIFNLIIQNKLNNQKSDIIKYIQDNY